MEKIMKNNNKQKSLVLTKSNPRTFNNNNKIRLKIITKNQNQ